MAAARLAGVELGGMSIRTAVADGVEGAKQQQQWDTYYSNEGGIVHFDPAQVLQLATDWLDERFKEKPFAAIGIASFGPIDPNTASPTYGTITKGTPKKRWRGVNVVEPFLKYGVPILFDTDVNAPALHEYHLAKRTKPSISSCAYITNGTGIGVGLVVNNKPVHGLMHPEAGHILFPRMAGDDFAGMPDHPVPEGVESMVSAPSLARRCGYTEPKDLVKVPESDPAWDAFVHYMAGLCSTLVLVVSPEKIVLGGGVMQASFSDNLLKRIRGKVKENLNGYLQQDEILEEREDYITGASTSDAGLVGALALAQEALNQQ